MPASASKDNSQALKAANKDFVLLRKNLALSAEKDGRFAREQFQYDEAQDRHTCPGGEALEACGKARERGGRLVQAYTSKASTCAWPGGRMEKRGQLAEHPFGTLKHRAGLRHFLVRGLEKCRGEFSLMVLGYNFTRALNLLGPGALREHCARRNGNPAKMAQYA